MKMTFFLRFDAFSQWISRHPQLVTTVTGAILGSEEKEPFSGCIYGTILGFLVGITSPASVPILVFSSLRYS
jgi:hypothetical protein